jgi:hypothetical protein
METLEALPWIFASMRAMIGKTPYHIGPSSIPCRDNPYGAAVANNPDNRRVCLSDADPRQRGLFAASWALGLYAAATYNKIDAIALGSATGPQGAIARDGVNPVYHILRGLGSCIGARSVNVLNSDPTLIAAVAQQSKTNRILWLANLTSEKQVVNVDGLATMVNMQILDEKCFDAMKSSADYLMKSGTSSRTRSGIELGPYAVARLTAD